MDKLNQTESKNELDSVIVSKNENGIKDNATIYQCDCNCNNNEIINLLHNNNVKTQRNETGSIESINNLSQNENDIEEDTENDVNYDTKEGSESIDENNINDDYDGNDEIHINGENEIDDEYDSDGNNEIDDEYDSDNENKIDSEYNSANVKEIDTKYNTDGVKNEKNNAKGKDYTRESYEQDYTNSFNRLEIIDGSSTYTNENLSTENIDSINEETINLNQENVNEETTNLSQENVTNENTILNDSTNSNTTNANQPEADTSNTGGTNNNLGTVYRVQVGVYSSFSNAMNSLANFMQMGYTGNIIPYRNFFAVQLGEFNNLDDAVEFEKELRANGYDTLMVKVGK